MRFQLKIKTDHNCDNFWMSEIIANESKLWRSESRAAKDAGQERVFKMPPADQRMSVRLRH